MLQTSGFTPASHTQLPDTFVVAQASAPSGSSSSTSVKLRKAAGEFEAILLESLWKSMKGTFEDQDDGSFDPTLESYNDWGIQGMASAVGKSGGLGIKNMILKYLAPETGETQSGVPPTS